MGEKDIHRTQNSGHGGEQIEWELSWLLLSSDLSPVPPVASSFRVSGGRTAGTCSPLVQSRTEEPAHRPSGSLPTQPCPSGLSLLSPWKVGTCHSRGGSTQACGSNEDRQLPQYQPTTAQDGRHLIHRTLYQRQAGDEAQQGNGTGVGKPSQKPMRKRDGAGCSRLLQDRSRECKGDFIFSLCPAHQAKLKLHVVAGAGRDGCS